MAVLGRQQDLMDRIDRVFTRVAEWQAGRGPTIACLYTGADCPSSCAPMLRDPEPVTGQELNDSFVELLSTALTLNDAVHDGAIMLGRTSASEEYRITGWSYRLFPLPTATESEPNRGSAFNSCLAMSVVTGIDRIYLVGPGRVYRFREGSFVELLQQSEPPRQDAR